MYVLKISMLNLLFKEVHNIHYEQHWHNKIVPVLDKNGLARKIGSGLWLG